MKTQDAISEISARLSEYITTHLKLTINSKGFWKCKTGLHEDNEPSCHVIPYNHAVWKYCRFEMIQNVKKIQF